MHFSLIYVSSWNYSEAHQRPSVTALFSWQVRECHGRLMGRDKGRGRSLTCNLCRQNRFDLGKNLFNLLVIKNQSRIMGNENISSPPHLQSVPHTLSLLLLPPQGLDSSYFSSMGSLPNCAMWFFLKGWGSSWTAPPRPLLQHSPICALTRPWFLSVRLLSSRKCCSPSTCRLVLKEFNCNFLFTSPLGVNFLKPRESHSSIVLKGTTVSHTFNIVTVSWSIWKPSNHEHLRQQ